MSFAGHFGNRKCITLPNTLAASGALRIPRDEQS
jgi:hypothetical protein